MLAQELAQLLEQVRAQAKKEAQAQVLEQAQVPEQDQGQQQLAQLTQEPGVQVLALATSTCTRRHCLDCLLRTVSLAKEVQTPEASAGCATAQRSQVMRPLGPGKTLPKPASWRISETGMWPTKPHIRSPEDLLGPQALQLAMCAALCIP